MTEQQVAEIEKVKGDLVEALKAYCAAPTSANKQAVKAARDHFRDFSKTVDWGASQKVVNLLLTLLAYIIAIGPSIGGVLVEKVEGLSLPAPK